MVSPYEAQNARFMNFYLLSYQVFYFLNRYCLLFALVGMSVTTLSFRLFLADKNTVPSPSMWQRQYIRRPAVHPD